MRPDVNLRCVQMCNCWCASFYLFSYDRSHQTNLLRHGDIATTTTRQRSVGESKKSNMILVRALRGRDERSSKSVTSRARVILSRARVKNPWILLLRPEPLFRHFIALCVDLDCGEQQTATHPSSDWALLHREKIPVSRVLFIRNWGYQLYFFSRALL